jgi:proteasome lid subunit RPN8/RPN11
VPKNSNVKGWSHPEKKKRPGLADRRPTSENPNQILWDNTAWTNWKRTTHHTCVSVYLYI